MTSPTGEVTAREELADEAVRQAEQPGAEARFETVLDSAEHATTDLDVEVLVERYRELASRLMFSCDDNEHVSLAITSAVAGEGVTTSCVAAALALAKSTTKRVLLLDANMRRPTAHTMMGSPFEPGLFQMIVARRESKPASAKGAMAAHRTSLPNLWVTPAGMRLEDPTQLMTSASARDAIASLLERFDYAVLDCPAVLTSVDASALCRLATRTAMVVRAELTPREEVERACARLGTGIMGVLLNGVER